MQISNRNYERALRLMLAFLMVIIVPVSLRAAHWTAVGSTGTVDESDLGQVGFYQGVAFNGGYGTTTLRYNVTATDALSGGNKTRLKVRYLDPGYCTRVEACLFQYSFGGTNTLLMTFNSDLFPPTLPGFQTQVIESPSPPASTALAPFDFANNGYYVEVYLIDICGSGNARIGLLSLDRIP